MGGREGDGEVDGDMDECEANGEKGGIVDSDEGDGDGDGDEGDGDGDGDNEDGGEGAEGEGERDRENDVGATTPSLGSTGKQSVHFRDECTTYPTPVRALHVSAA